MQVSMDTLGVVEHRWMDHCDGEVSDVPDAVGVDQIAAVIEEVKPDTLLTFGPDGMTGHSDHITVGRWATVAAENSEHRPRVLHAASDAHLMGVMEHHFSTFPIYMGGRPPLVSRSDAGLALELPERIISQKIAALRAQPSQTEPLLEHMGEQDYREWVSVEVFVDAGKSA
jgi:LmbE family N-acetylglucosaminyl deacetylase